LREDRGGRLKRYILNSPRFLWGVWSQDDRIRGQRGIYEQLRDEILRLYGARRPFLNQIRGSYRDVAETLFNELGVEDVINNLVVKPVERQVSQDTLKFLRERWQKGHVPTTEELRAMGLVELTHAETQIGDKLLNKLPLFIEVNTQFNYVVGWTPFAGIWFEEIEHRDDD